MCFIPKMPIHPCTRLISTYLTTCILNQAHRFNPNRRQPKVNRSKCFMPSSYFFTGRWAAPIAAIRDPETGGHLLLSLQPPADPHEAPELESTRFLSPRHERWGRFVMDHWEVFFFNYFICSRLWNNEAFSSGWCLVGLSGGVLPLGQPVLSCVMQSQVAVLNIWGCVVDALKDREEEEH